jgi:hypothetical protein
MAHSMEWRIFLLCFSGSPACKPRRDFLLYTILFQRVSCEKILDLIYSQFVDYKLYQLLHDIWFCHSFNGFVDVAVECCDSSSRLSTKHQIISYS